MPSLLHRCLKNPRVWLLVLACYWVALFIGTHIPGDRLALNRGNADKFAHVAAFGVLSLLTAAAWRLFTGRLHLGQLLWVWTIVVLFGAIDETTQPVMNRNASLIDWLADAIGATLGLAIFWLWSERWLNNLVPATEISSAEGWPRAWRGYSLKTLFVAMILAALACYWIMLPTMNAQRFVRALQEHDYATAESLFASGADAFPGNFKNYDHFTANAGLVPWTWNELLNGERRINVGISYGNDDGMIGCGADVSAYRDGLKMGLLVP